MKTNQFECKTKSGHIVRLKAVNMPQKLNTNYEVVCLPRNGERLYFAKLSKQQVKGALNVELPHHVKECCIKIVDQTGWEEFVRDCSIERLELEEERLEKLFPGLNEIQEAQYAEDAYELDFIKAMEDEGSCVFPTPPEVKVEDLLKKYPRAAAYRKAQGFYSSSNVGQVQAGAKAISRLENGEDYKVVIDEMEEEWSKYCEAHIWD